MTFDNDDFSVGIYMNSIASTMKSIGGGTSINNDNDRCNIEASTKDDLLR